MFPHEQFCVLHEQQKKVETEFDTSKIQNEKELLQINKRKGKASHWMFPPQTTELVTTLLLAKWLLLLFFFFLIFWLIFCSADIFQHLGRKSVEVLTQKRLNLQDSVDLAHVEPCLSLYPKKAQLPGTKRKHYRIM